MRTIDSLHEVQTLRCKVSVEREGEERREGTEGRNRRKEQRVNPEREETKQIEHKFGE